MINIQNKVEKNEPDKKTYDFESLFIHIITHHLN